MAYRSELRSCNKIALVIDSSGGYASAAYKIATMLRRHCSGFTAVVPRYAKSAATLLALGADSILMGSDAELGPLDAQLADPEREEFVGALDETQALERLNAAALSLLDETMMLLLMRTDKKIETLLPHITHFTAEMMRPLLEKIDAVHYSQYARVLKVAEEYAVRLMEPQYGEKRAEQIARYLVNEYSEHGFVISRDEASELLDLKTANDDQQKCVDELEEWLTLNRVQAIGQLTTEGNGGEVQ
jgi:membrane-bound ClpP family serine protease